MQIFSVSEVSGGSYCNHNPKDGIETFYTVTCNNFKQSRIQCLVYLLQIMNSCGLHIVQWWQMSIGDAAPKGLIFELSELHDYSYSQNYVLLIFLTSEF